MESWRTVKKTIFLLFVLTSALVRKGQAKLNITQGRITFISDFNLETYPVVGIATVELGGDTSSRPTYFFDCVTDRNNGSGLRWTRATTNHRFAVAAIPDGTHGVRMDVGGFDYEDLDIYTCSDQNSADVVTLNITDFNPAILANAETVSVAQGQTTELEVFVSGYPVPIESDITWQHPNGSLISSSSAGISFQEGGRKLVISNVQANQAGMYRVTVVISFSPYMGQSTFIQLNVHVPTVFLTQPTESVAAVEWSEVTLMCSASGVPAPQIRWEKENELSLPVGTQPSSSMNGDTTTGQLVFSKIRYDSRGRYRCRADNGQTAAVFSQYTDVRITPALKLYDSRMEEVDDIFFVANGTRVNLECFGSGTLTWTSSTGSEIRTSESGNIYQSYDQTRDALALVIRNFTSATTAIYTCTTDLINNYNSLIATSVLITSSNPSVILRSRVEYVLPGNTTTLEARVHATPQNQASVRWYHEERLIDDTTEPRYTASSDGDIYRLVVSNIGDNEVGRYTIVASLNGVSTNDTALISFPQPPSATVTPSSVTVNEGEEVRLRCVAEGSGALTIIWTMAGGSPLPVGVQENGNELIIPSASSSHPGTYVCSVSNLAGTMQDEADLIVFYPPRTVISFNEMTSTPDQPLYFVRDDGAPGPTIVCSVDGHLPPLIRWVQENGRGLPNGITQSVQPNGDVQLRWQRPMEFTDSGSYICQASNNVGNSSATLDVLVQIEPSISSIYPFSSDITQDSQTFTYTVPRYYIGSTLVCAANGWPAPEVEWRQDGQPLPTDGFIVSELSTMVATVSARLRWTREFLSSDAGSYECIVRKPNTVVPVTSQTVQLKVGSTTPSVQPETCSVQGRSEFFQIRVFGTDCENWGGSLSSHIATEFRSELLSVVRTECSCQVDESELEVLGSPQCSTKVAGAAVFRGQIESDSQDKAEDIFCSLFSWQQKSPLVRINEQFQAVDRSCSLRASGSLNSEECVAPESQTSTFGQTEIATIAAVAGVTLLLLLFVIILLFCCIVCHYYRRNEQKGEFNINIGEETDHTYARTDSFSKYGQSAVRPAGGAEEPVYSTLTRGTEPPHEAIALHHVQGESGRVSEDVDSPLQGQSSRSQLQRAEAYQIPVSSQENLTSPAPGSVGNFQAMKRNKSSTSTGYDSTTHLLGQAQMHPSNSSTNNGNNVISATSPFNDYEHIDGDDAFSLNSPNSLNSNSPTIPGKPQGWQQSAGSLHGVRQSPKNLKQPAAAMSTSMPLANNPPQNVGPVFAVVEEDAEDIALITGSHQEVTLQQSRPAGGNHSPSGSVGSPSPHVMKQALMAEFQSADNMTNSKGRESSNFSEPPPPYSSRPSSEGVLVADSAEQSTVDSGAYVGVDKQQHPWYQASNLSIDSDAQQNAAQTSSSSQTSTSTDGERIQPYAMIHNEHIPYPRHHKPTTSSSSIKESSNELVMRHHNQRSNTQTKPPAQPYTNPIRSSVASLGHAQESATFFEVVV